ncbi:uncharacterized protein LOC117335940 isoform X2 [Pecten maximus]|uniref:uncharacterized protein LOC117335940 isoform X2 n=1 Tax=Pecten maximus TaxID=6579 RepID=UPI001458F2C1|nr:uncharacterized protein LOC117335940 isoform X2 [Pecten maximus]
MTGKRRNQSGLQTLAQGSLALARTHATEEVLHNIEDQLEKELIQEEAASKSVKPLARVRHKGQKFLHSKHVLLVIVGLNVLDCILVLGELILDVHFIVDLLDTADRQSQHFLNTIEEKYPDVPPVQDIDGLYSELLLANISWRSKSVGDNSYAAIRHHKKRDLTYTNKEQISEPQNTQNSNDFEKHAHSLKDIANLGNTSFKPIKHAQGYAIQTTTNDLGNDTYPHGHGHVDLHAHSLEEEIAHGLHKASITILAILVFETGIKVFCEGRRILERKVEVFDSIIVVVSITLDLVFIKGLTMFPIQKYVFILAFLVPWRVIRVVNSLIVAVMDHGHFRLKLLYSQKKKISASLKSTKNELKALQVGMEGVRKLCTEAGIPEWKLQQCLVGENNNQHSSKPHSTLAFFSSKSPMKRHGSDPKPEVNGKGGRLSTTSTTSSKSDVSGSLGQQAKDHITLNNSSVILLNIEESNESTELMNKSENRDSP